MHDIKWIRDNPEAFDQGMVKRGLEPLSGKVLTLDKEQRSDVSALQDLQQKSNEYAKQIGTLRSQGENADELIAKSKEIKAQIAALKDQADENIHADHSPVHELLSSIPNVPANDVPEGETEEDNIELRKWGKIPSFSFEPKQHFDIGEGLGMMDFEQSAKISGSRFVTLFDGLSKLERALAQFMLSVTTNEFDYREVTPPALVRDNAMFGSGQLPKFAEDAFRTTNDYWLIPTSEVYLVNLVNDTILNEEELPLRFTAYSPCFRSEAGSAGKDTRGMIRQHQFSKVEMISITSPEESEAEHERMTSIAEEILQRLELPYRVVVLCVGDTGFNARKTYDLEVWLPGQDAYREISSVSNCGAFQARRMKARYRKPNEKETHFVHTLNGSALAIGRTMVAILENYQNEDGSVTIPEVLRPYMGGLEVLKRND